MIYVNKKVSKDDLVGDLGPKNKPTTEKIIWGNEPPAEGGRQWSRDVIIGTVGNVKPRSKASAVKSISEALDLYFTNDMYELILQHTNGRILKTIAHTKVERIDDDRVTHLKVTPIDELKALFGLQYFRGLLGQGLQSQNHLFSDTSGHFVFGATMSLSRFTFLLSHISFDDRNTRPEKWTSDRFAAMRELFEMFNRNLSKCIAPSEYLSIGETLYPMRHQIAFRQYNPKKQQNMDFC